jgi:hypothetical protein
MSGTKNRRHYRDAARAILRIRFGGPPRRFALLSDIFHRSSIARRIDADPHSQVPRLHAGGLAAARRVEVRIRDLLDAIDPPKR